MQSLDWIKCEGDVWCKLSTVNLEHIHFEGMEGVYIIWHGGPVPHTVYVGQGVIKRRLLSHRSELPIQTHAKKGELYVTWAAVPDYLRDGIEAYLFEHLRPLEGQRHPSANAIQVNLPW